MHYAFEPGVANARFSEALWGSVSTPAKASPPPSRYSPTCCAALTRTTIPQYVEANGLFADAVASVHKEGDLLWVQDYHLTILPRLLRERQQCSAAKAAIGFFLHTPMPSAEVFALLPTRREVLRGMLACDLTGFHTHDYSRNFLRACKADLPDVTVLASSVLVARPGQRATRCVVRADPIGIEPSAFEAAVAEPAAQKLLATYAAKYVGQNVICAVDRLDPIKGVEHRLLGFQALLQRHRELIGKVTLIQVAVPSRADVGAYKDLTASVNTLVGEINAEFSTLAWTPIAFLYRSVEPAELAALYALADVCLVTSVRDGFNLVACEYVACQSSRAAAAAATPTSSSQAPGVLVLSEFAGAAQSLAGALRVNPWSLDDLVTTTHRALTMPALERSLRHKKSAADVNLHTSRSWASAFVAELSELADEREREAAGAKEAPIDTC